MHIAIAGNIGAGKTSLTELLAKHYKWEPQYEDVVQNPYLDDFYASFGRKKTRSYWLVADFQTHPSNLSKFQRGIFTIT